MSARIYKSPSLEALPKYSLMWLIPDMTTAPTAPIQSVLSFKLPRVRLLIPAKGSFPHPSTYLLLSSGSSKILLTGNTVTPFLPYSL